MLTVCSTDAIYSNAGVPPAFLLDDSLTLPSSDPRSRDEALNIVMRGRKYKRCGLPKPQRKRYREIRYWSCFPSLQSAFSMNALNLALHYFQSVSQKNNQRGEYKERDEVPH